MATDPFSHRPPRTWLKITVTTPAATAESTAAFLGALTESGVEHCPDPSGAAAETIIGYLADDADLERKRSRLEDFLTTLADSCSGCAPPTFTTARLVEEDWGASWKRHFRPFKITPRVVIRPSWEEYLPGPGEIVLEMDPGMAFGTGHHASTRMALDLCESLFEGNGIRPERVLDLGTGTGILAMACVLLGAEEAIAIDNDPDAVAAARDNVARNGLAQKIAVSGDEVTALEGQFDLIVANITQDVLTGLAPALVSRLAAPSHLILAGILQGDQAATILKTYEDLGLTATDQRESEEWTALRFTRQGREI